MGRLPDLSLPIHSAIVGEKPEAPPEVVVVAKYGADRPATFVQCPECKLTRIMILSKIRQEIREGRFTGRCKKCRKWTLTHGRHKTRAGYVALTFEGIPPEHESMYRRIEAQKQEQHARKPDKPLEPVFEHELVMATLLGRPMIGVESIRHRDGVKSNNKPSNLELCYLGKPFQEGATILSVLDQAREIVRFWEAYEPALREHMAAEPEKVASAVTANAAQTTAPTSEEQPKQPESKPMGLMRGLVKSFDYSKR